MLEGYTRDFGITPMSRLPIHDPKHWRERAEEARVIAEQMPAHDPKQTMLGIAAAYEKLEKLAEAGLLKGSL
jgi:hypothetical protein